jgi:hypothetical protein
MMFPRGAIIYNITNLPKASASTARQVAIAVAIGGNLLQNSKMRRRQNFAASPSKRDFGNPTPHNELTKAAGWKPD